MLKLLVAPTLVAAALLAADTPEFKDPQVRATQERYISSKKAYLLALERAALAAYRANDLAEGDRLRVEIASLETGAPPADESAIDLSRKINGTKWLWRGGPAVVEFAQGGGFTSTRWQSPGSWTPRNAFSVDATEPGGERWEIVFDSQLRHFLCVTPSGEARSGMRVD